MASALRVQVSPSAFNVFWLTAMKKKSVAVVIVSNGPGELTTWVNPVVDEINKIKKSLCDKEKLDFTLRLVLVPCPNATG